jgi:flagellar export protein FliJ
MSNKPNKPPVIASLGLLTRLRETEVERLQADLARQETTKKRYQTSVERLTQLAVGSGPSGQPPAGKALSPLLAVNCGDYKQAVFALADTHRTDLHLHEANMAVAQRNLTAAWTRRELLGKVLARHEAAHARAEERATKKREDEIATQSWLAGRTA